MSDPNDPSTPPEGQGEPGQGEQGATQAQPVPVWYQELGFKDEGAAKESFRNAQRKISEQGSELSRLRQAGQHTATQQPDGQPTSQGIDVSFDDFVQKPGEVIRVAAGYAAKQAVSEVLGQQRLERMMDDAAAKEGVERWELQEVYQELQGNDPSRTLSLLAGIAKMRKQGYSVDQIKSAMEQGNQNKARATQVMGGAHVPLTQPTLSHEDIEKMDYPAIQKAMAEGKIVF